MYDTVVSKDQVKVKPSPHSIRTLHIYINMSNRVLVLSEEKKNLIHIYNMNAIHTYSEVHSKNVCKSHI